MRTTKNWRDKQRNALRYYGWGKCADQGPVKDPVEVDSGKQAHALFALLDDADALTTIALAAGLGADATEEEVAARVGEMREAERLLVAEQRAHAFADSPEDQKRPTPEAFDAHIECQRASVARILHARRLAEEAGR